MTTPRGRSAGGVALAAVLVVAVLASACSGDPTDGGAGDADAAPGGAEEDADADGGDPGEAVAAADGGWVVVWEDTFDADAGAPPDPRWWNVRSGGDGWGNAELQFYTDDIGVAQHDGEGHLVITASEGAPADASCWYGDCRYSSARIDTQGKVEAEYGRIEVRARMPEGDGTWAAFWMLGADIDLRGWPNAGEIDVVEFIGREPDTVHGTVHGPTYSGADGIGASTRLEDVGPSDDFHVYAVTWEPERIEWSVDDEVYGVLLPGLLPAARRWVFDGPFHLLLNLAIGGDWPGEPTPETDFPQRYVIDHVRVLAPVEGTDGEQ